MTTIRDIVPRRPKLPPQRRGTVIDVHLTPDPPRRAPMRDATIATQKLARGLRDLKQTSDRLGAAVTRLRDAVAPIAAARQATFDAQTREVERAERSAPASVQAANAARWPRPGR